MGCQLGSGWHNGSGTYSTTFWKRSGLLGESPAPTMTWPVSLWVRKPLLGTFSPGRSCKGKEHSGYMYREVRKACLCTERRKDICRKLQGA